MEGLEDFRFAVEGIGLVRVRSNLTVNDNYDSDLAESLHQVLTQWIQYKLGIAVFVKRKLNYPGFRAQGPGPSTIRGDILTIKIVANVGSTKSYNSLSF